jgi:CDP-glucose 4,6-dehydratase
VEFWPAEVENLVISSSFWLGRRVFLTGHTGFKGSWLTLMLDRLNARTTGYALEPPTQPSLFELAHIAECVDDIRGDIADLSQLREAMTATAPEIVIHMAAQPLVRAAYHDPVLTYATNVMGTVNVLEAARHAPTVRLVLIVTTDKCYDNKDQERGYRETDALGGRDPYSNSKACAELVASAYRQSFFSDESSAKIITARAGNVIGGGDFAIDRIVPDAVRAFMSRRSLRLRSPEAVRPWQHVLEPLTGYLRLIEAALTGATDVEGGWNFGPGPESERSVETLVARFARRWGPDAYWINDRGEHPHEARLLRLDSSKARETLKWSPLLDFGETIDWTAQWYRAFADQRDMKAITLEQVDAYLGQRVRLTSPLPRAFAANETRVEKASAASAKTTEGDRKRIFITGATGFLGCEISRQLLTRGHECAALIRRPVAQTRLAPLSQRLSLIHGNMFSPESYAEALAAFRPDVVIHSAWQRAAGAHCDEVGQLDNAAAAARLFEEAIACGAKTIIAVGSQAEYGPKAGAVAETARAEPTTLYGIAKLAACQSMTRMARAAGVRGVWGRVFSLYGPGDDDRRIMSMLIHAFRAKRSPDLTPCEQIWEFTHVCDAAHAIVMLLETPTADGIFNIGSGDATPLRDVVLKIRDRLAPRVEPLFGGIPYRQDQIMHLQADISRIRNVTGWSPKIPLDAGLEETIASILRTSEAA